MIAEGDLTGGVELFVERENDVRAVGDEQFFGCDGDAERLVAFDFRDEAGRIDYDSVANDVDFPVPENPGGE